MKWQKKTKNYERYELVDYPFFDSMVACDFGIYYISGNRTQLFNNLDDAKIFMIIDIYHECLKCIEVHGYLNRCKMLYASIDIHKTLNGYNNYKIKYNSDASNEEIEKLILRHINRFIREYEYLSKK